MNKSSLELLARLVAARSVSSKDPATDTSNAQAADVVAAMLDELGFATTLHDVPGLPGKVNVVGVAGPDEAGQGLLLAGHTDTVPCDPQAWATDPFELTERDGALHGLGACDMKGFFCVIAEALHGLDLARLRAPLRVWATANEECGMDGAMHLAQTAAPAAFALVGEPTSVTPVYGHKGALAEKIVCSGKSGHASVPDEGANALAAMSQVMAALRDHIEERAARTPAEDFVPPRPTLSLGKCAAGDSFNRIPDRCELWVDRRLVPGESVAEARRALRDAASRAVEGLPGIQIAFEPIVEGFEAVATAKDSELVTAAARICGRQPRTVAYATEAPYYAAAGMEVLVMGAGDIAVAHQPDEHVRIAELEQMAQTTRKLVEAFCCRD